MTEQSQSFLTMHEFVLAARQRLSDQAWAYIVGGTETETSMRRNRQSIDSLALRPRVLNDVSKIDCSTTLFGRRSRLPVWLCPIGGLESFDENGASSVAKAAATFGVPMFLSSVSSWSAEQLVAENGPDLSLVFQLYAREPAAAIDQLVERCIELQLPAFCVTVDSAVYSRRERDIAARFVKPWRVKGEGDFAHYQASLGWKDIERIRTNWDQPLILKGIATVEDALKAIDHGVDVIYVSNHGGRQLDHVRGSTSVLSDVLAAVDGRARVLVDGGYCRGTDLAKALALGADGVGLGRMMCLALAAAGSDGVVQMLELLEEELRITLGLLGVTHCGELDSSYVETVDALPASSALLSAFPLLRHSDLDAWM